MVSTFFNNSDSHSTQEGMIMKITKNTSVYSTRELKTIICHVHRYMMTLEKRQAPRWKDLAIHVRGRSRKYVTARAFYNGCGYVDGWDVIFTIPNSELPVHWFASLVYHELMHTYGYKHKQFTDISGRELAKLYPENYILQPAAPKQKAAASPIWQKRYKAALASEKRWLTKHKRAETALKKVRKKVRYYEATYLAA